MLLLTSSASKVARYYPRGSLDLLLPAENYTVSTQRRVLQISAVLDGLVSESNPLSLLQDCKRSREPRRALAAQAISAMTSSVVLSQQEENVHTVTNTIDPSCRLLSDAKDKDMQLGFPELRTTREKRGYLHDKEIIRILFCIIRRLVNGRSFSYRYLPLIRMASPRSCAIFVFTLLIGLYRRSSILMALSIILR